MTISKYALLLSGVCAAVCPAGVAAQHVADDRDPTTIFRAEGQSENSDIVVTASGFRQDRDDIGQSISVVTQEELDTRQVRVLSDALQRLPGVTAARNGGVGGPTSVFIRGADSSQTLVLIDGVRINDPSQPSGGFNFGNLLTGNIARVEVLRGPNSVIWGSQAIGGVVNIQTVEPTEATEITARGEYGFRDTVDTAVNIAGSSGAISGSLGGGYFRTDGISAFSEARGGTERDGFENFGANGKLRVQVTPDLELDFRGFYMNSDVEFDNPPADTIPQTDTEQFVGYVGANFALFDGMLQNRLAYTRTDITRITTDPTPGSFNPFEALGRLDRFEYRGVAEVAEPLTLVFGAEHEESESSTFFEAFDAAPDLTNTSLTSMYGQAVVRPFDWLTLTGGVRVDDQQEFGSETSLGANFAYSPNGGNTILRGTFAQGFRAPALPELLANFGNPNLQPEIAESFDIGVEQSFADGRVRAQATYFHRDTEDLIVFSAATFSLENIAEARAQGVEVAVWVNPVENLTIQGQYSLIDTQNRSAALDFFGNSNFGNELARRPNQTVSLIADWQSPWGVNIGGDILVVDDSFDDVANTTPLQGYVLTNIRASYDLTERITVAGRIENLFNEQYETAFNFGAIGRAAYVSVRLGM